MIVQQKKYDIQDQRPKLHRFRYILDQFIFSDKIIPEDTAKNFNKMQPWETTRDFFHRKLIA